MMSKLNHIKSYPDTQRDNPVLKKLADIVKEHDMAGAILIVIEKDEEEDFLFLSYHRKGFRHRVRTAIQKIDSFIGYLWTRGERFR